MSGWPSGLRRQTQGKTFSANLVAEWVFWSTNVGVGSNPTSDKTFMQTILNCSYQTHLKPFQCYVQQASVVFEGNYKSKVLVRSGIRTHAHRSGLRPERSALDRSAILTLQKQGVRWLCHPRHAWHRPTAKFQLNHWVIFGRKTQCIPVA